MRTFEFELRPIPGTENYLIRHRLEGEPVVLVAEVVKLFEGYSLYRMDATGVLAVGLDSADDALEVYTAWVEAANPAIVGVPES